MNTEEALRYIQDILNTGKSVTLNSYRGMETGKMVYSVSALDCYTEDYSLLDAISLHRESEKQFGRIWSPIKADPDGS